MILKSLVSCWKLLSPITAGWPDILESLEKEQCRKLMFVKSLIALQSIDNQDWNILLSLDTSFGDREGISNLHALLFCFVYSKSPDGNHRLKNKHWRGVTVNSLRLAFCPIQHCPVCSLCCCLLVVDEVWPSALMIHNGNQKPPKTHLTTNHLCFPLWFSMLNSCITTAGRNAFPSQQLWHSLHSLSLRLIPCSCRGRWRHWPHAGPHCSAPEALCHFCLSPPNPLCWPQSDQRLMKKQMAVTDTVRNCG